MTADEGQNRQDRRPKPSDARLPRADQNAVLDDTVIVQRHWHKHHIPSGRTIPRNDVAQNAQFRRAGATVEAEPTLGEDRLSDALGCRHLDIARQDPAIERPVRPTPYEVGPHHADQA